MSAGNRSIGRLFARRRALWLPALALAGLAGSFALVNRLGAVPQAVRQEGQAWVADRDPHAEPATCRECHPAETNAQLASHHAQTVRELGKQPPLAPFGNGQEVVDPFTGARYAMEKSGGGHEIVVRVGANEARQSIAYEVGSGAIAHGYLAKLDDAEWLDARLNYYAATGAWDFTSGQDKPAAHLRTQPLGRPQHPADILRCFACHGTVIRADRAKPDSGDGSGLRVRPDRSSLGVTCEACHGPRGAHVAARRAGRPEPIPPRPTAHELNAVCGRCHGLTNVDPAHPVLARFQPWGLEQSACFQRSGGRLSCLTCHDPHANSAKGAAFFDSKCLGCHQGGSGDSGAALCKAGKTANCVSCHMRRDTTSMLHTALTDHRIGLPAAVAAQERSARAAAASQR